MSTASTSATTKACAACTHFLATSATAGECRRQAPQTIAFQVDKETRFESRFPVTKTNDWCGEYSGR